MPLSTTNTEFSAQKAIATRRGGFLDFFLMLSLFYAVYAMTPVGALGEYGIRAALGQKKRPNLFATFRGYDIQVELGDVNFSENMLASISFPREVISASEKTGVDREILMSLLLAFGKCEAGKCSVKTPPFLGEALDGLSLDENCSLEHLAFGIQKASLALAPQMQKYKQEELAVEALYIGPFLLKQTLLRAKATQLKKIEEIDVHGSFLPPSVRRGTLQPALQVLAMHRLRTLAWPAEKKWRVSSPFGERVHPVLGTRRFHNGTDLAVPTGTPLLAAHLGAVRRAGRDAVSGNYIKIDHGFGIETTYCHLSRVDVKIGERVERKEVIGKSGATGRITGPHLHYILRLQGKPVNAEQYGDAPARQSGGKAMIVVEGKGESQKNLEKKNLEKKNLEKKNLEKKNLEKKNLEKKNLEKKNLENAL